MQVVNCKAYAAEILEEVSKAETNKKMIIFSVGDNPASQAYIRGKLKDCTKCGVPYEHITFATEDNQEDLKKKIQEANQDPEVGGMIVQLPLPAGWKEEDFLPLVSPEKDLDGLVEHSRFYPCTPQGVMYILHKEIGNLDGKNALVIGRSKLVGKPLSEMLLKENCTVTIAHSHTKNLESFFDRYDIIVSAVGRKGLVDLKKCQAEIVVDVGINYNDEGKLCGDCQNFEDTESGLKVTPVPGGIGLMTRAMLMHHMIE